VTQCDHSESLYGRCTRCGMTWEQQAQARVARLELERATGMPRWKLERSKPAQQQQQQRVADELAARRGAKITRGRP